MQDVFLDLVLLVDWRHAPFFVVFCLLFKVIIEENTGIVRSIYRLFKILQLLLFDIGFPCLHLFIPVCKWTFPLFLIKTLVKACSLGQVLPLLLDLGQEHFVVIQLLLLLLYQLRLSLLRLIVFRLDL